MARKGKVTVDQERCKGCWICIEVCPEECLSVDSELNRKGYQPAQFDGEPKEDRKGCTGCTMCAIVCPEAAIEVYRAK